MSVTENSARRGTARWTARAASIAVVGLIALAACGSSKPSYCSARANLENSIKGLTAFNPSSGVSGLKAQLTKIQNDANTVVSQAKSDFPSETTAVKSSIDAFAGAVNGLSGNPSAAQIGQVASSASNVATSIQDFMNATKSKCS